MLKFGPAGIPVRCTGGSVEGIKCTGSLGLEAMELEFVQGCRMKDESAIECGLAAKEAGVSLSCHASYYLNLLSPEPPKLKRTHSELERTAEVLSLAGGSRLVFHAGFYLKLDVPSAYEKMKVEMKALVKAVEGKGVFLAPEVTGKESQFGSLEELYRLAEDVGYDKVRPAIDWGHIHARDNGSLQEKGDFTNVLEVVERHVGKEGLRTLHCHMEGIEFTEKGERRHLRLAEGPPDYRLLLEALREFKCGGTVISESPAMEDDALVLQKAWKKLYG